MTERVNLVDAYDNRSVIAKMVSMEERISGAETSVEASAEAAASSASAAAASQTAAKTSETNAKASADTAAATLSNTVDLSSKQTVTGAKTFAGDTTVTGSFVTSGNAEMSKLDIDTGKLTVGSGGSAEINGPLTATNPANALQAANHDSVLTSNDVLTAKDINEPNGSANNLLHRSGNNDEAKTDFLRCITHGSICVLPVTGSNYIGKWCKIVTLNTYSGSSNYWAIINVQNIYGGFNGFHNGSIAINHTGAAGLFTTLATSWDDSIKIIKKANGNVEIWSKATDWSSRVFTVDVATYPWPANSMSMASMVTMPETNIANREWLDTPTISSGDSEWSISVYVIKPTKLTS